MLHHSTAPTETRRTKVSRRVILALTGAVALPPLAIDMYLASLPEIGDVFDVPVAISQLSLTSFLLVLGLGQLIAGPITDAVGRRSPMVVGLVAFVLGSALAALAPTISVLLIARVIQGAGGAVAVVVANSSVRDYASGADATKLYALLMSAVAVAPVLAPTIGGFIDTTFGWRAIFWTLAGLGVVLLICAVTILGESLPAERRAPLRLGAVFRGYRDLLTRRAFILPAAALIAMFGLLFSYIGGASYVYQIDYGLNPAVFGLVFGATGVSMLAASLLVNRLSGRFTSLTLGVTGGALSVAGTLGALLAVTNGAAFAVLVCAIIVTVFGLGMAEPALMGQAMNATDHRAGQAAALLGGAQFILGAVATILAGPLAEATSAGWTLALAACAALGLILALIARRGAPRSASQA